MTFWLRACPKCGGDLEAVEDILGTYVECVQCGLELTSAQETVLRRGGRVHAATPAPVPAVAHEGRHQSAA